jgi:spermidine dehydrogenase
VTSKLNITRRDFLNGVALGTAAGCTLSPVEWLAAKSAVEVYPPALTGLRGAHVGSFEVAHAVALGDTRYSSPRRQTDSTYDLVVVGAGLSGLAAAFLFRQQIGANACILLIDNHDDFGGHAKRNEFDVDGRRLIGYGGGQSIDAPASYSAGARQILLDLGVDVERFYQYFDREFYSSRGLDSGVYFSAAAYGRRAVAPAVMGWNRSGVDARKAIEAYPLDSVSKNALLDLLTGERDYLNGAARAEKIRRLRAMSYRQYLLDVVGVSNDVYLLFRDTPLGLWGVGYDALSALEAYRLGAPGFSGLGLGELGEEQPESEEPYIFHFPDGNASIARLLVRALVPGSIAGATMEDIVAARLDYQQLDEKNKPVRIRLDSAAVEVRHTNGKQHVDVTYVREGIPERVRGRHVIWAGYNSMLPFVCPELPAKQVEAIAYASKVPICYINIAIRNWQAFAQLGYNGFFVPKPELMHSFGMDFPVSMGAYEYTQEPEEATLLHGVYVPTVPDQGLTAREQHTAGRRLLYEKPYAAMEKGIVSQLQGALDPGGFDAERDIAGITVNRWPHGYAYEYNELSDPIGWGPDTGPHVLGRAQLGRISIANSDASAFAYVNGAFDAAIRAVDEQLEVE